MVLILSTVLMMVAGAWCVALFTGLAIVRLVPRGERINAWFTLGWWQFGKLQQFTGPAILPLQRRYIPAFVAFFAAILLGVVLTVVLGTEARNGKPEAQAALDHYDSFPLLPTGTQET